MTAVLAVALIWMYFIFFAQPANEDKLNDATFPTAAEPVCKATLDRLQQIGVVNQKAGTPQERADLAGRADAELTTMVTKLKTIAIPNSDDAHALNAWLADWDQWLADRAEWVGKLQKGQDAQFLEKQREDGSPNSKALNDFAQINGMRSCATPGGI